jgi:hypothetical protein
MFRLMLEVDPTLAQQIKPEELEFISQRLKEVSAQHLSDVEKHEERKHGELLVSEGDVSFSLVPLDMRRLNRLTLICVADSRYNQQWRMARWGRWMEWAVTTLYHEPALHGRLTGTTIEVLMAKPVLAE